MEGCARMDLLLLCFQHVVLFYHILLQLDSFTPYKDLLLQQLMVDTAEVTAMGMEGAKYNENLDSSALLPLLQGTGQCMLKTLRQKYDGTTFCSTQFLLEAKGVDCFLSHVSTHRNHPPLGFSFETSILTEASALSALHSKDSGLLIPSTAQRQSGHIGLLVVRQMERGFHSGIYLGQRSKLQ